MALVFPQAEITGNIGGTGLSSRKHVHAATTLPGNINIDYANGSTIDGVTLATGDRILIKNQTVQTENGVYIVKAAGQRTRQAQGRLKRLERLNARLIMMRATLSAAQ